MTRGGRANRRPGRSGGRAATKRSGGHRCRHRRRGTGGSLGGRSQGGREEPGWEGGPRRDKRGGATQALEEEDGGDAAPEMNVLCGADSDKEEGLLGLREVGDISNEEAAAAFSSDEEEEDEEGAEDVGVVHMLAAVGDLRPGPAYV